MQFHAPKEQTNDGFIFWLSGQGQTQIKEQYYSFLHTYIHITFVLIVESVI